ncbi:MAG: isocitrate lyase/PEP mutase family protein [Deltaproteobacteria bacterium]|nr:isocitrate lyase/PEP mutase family protein [Deltaproteobacteria bacterium]
MKKTTTLRNAIMDRRALVVPGCHDALSAKVIEACGFEAVQISGMGISSAFIGMADVSLVHIKDVIDISANIAKAVGIPVMADLDTGGGNAINAARLTEDLIRMGLGGMNIEDQVFPKRCGHMAGKEVISAEEMAGKIRACAEVRNRLDPDFIINARTDTYALMGLEEAIRRGNRYLEAGADLIFIDGIGTKKDMETAVAALSGPLSVNLMEGVTGVKTEMVPIPELARMGVGRVSIPVASFLVAHNALMKFFSALKASPSGLLEGETAWITDFKQFNDFVGLDAYRALEDKLLPKERLEAKYKGGGKIADW